MFRYVVALAVFLVALALVFVRLAPFDADRYHRPAFPAAAGDYPARNGHVAIRALTASGEDVMRALDGHILKMPRTKRMAGLPGADLITYQTNSLIFGFPDYTNVSIIGPGDAGNAGEMIAIRGRARFGVSDLGVNRRRVEGLLDALGPLTVAP